MGIIIDSNMLRMQKRLWRASLRIWRSGRGHSILPGVPVFDQQLAEETPGESGVVSSLVQVRHAHNITRNDTVASSSIFLPANYEIKDRKLISLSTASTGSNSGRELVIDYIPVREQIDIDLIEKDVKSLARVLSNADPELFSLLPCHGAIKCREPSTQRIAGFNIIFSVQEKLIHARPSCLSSLLLTSPTSHSLNERVKLAVSLARSIVFLHSSYCAQEYFPRKHRPLSTAQRCPRKAVSGRFRAIPSSRRAITHFG